MTGTLRTFIAIELDPLIRQELAKLQKELNKSGADAKWVKPENIHLTLKFLGDTPINKIETINSILQEIANQFNSFEISLSQIGTFPKVDSPRVIWVDIIQGKEAVLKLAGEIEDKFLQVGFPKEGRAFQAHVTIARIRSPLNKINLVKQIKEIKPPQFTQAVDKLTFFKSTLTPQGPIYEILKEISLKTS